MNCVNFLLFLKLVFYLNNEVFAQGSCLKTYTNISIYGNDLNGVQGTISQCCQLCQQKLGCRAYTWDSFNGGTCWLKSATQPLSKVDPHGSGYSITGILSPSANETYTLNQTYAAPNFFDTWHFDGWGLTNVTRDVDKQTAQNLGMIGYQNGKVYIGLDHKNVYNTTGRPSIMLQTNYLYNSGLFVLSLDHMPTGPGTWPAFWTAGPNWPNQGEIDILEGVSNMTSNLVTIHVGDNCYEKTNDSMFFTGIWNGDKSKPYFNCYQYAKKNATFDNGCSIHAAEGTFNTNFNKAGGGVFAMQWERQKYIRVWNFVQPNIPVDILQESPNPNPDTWGLPTAFFNLGTNCSPDHFSNQTIIFDIALCGSWVSLFIPGGEAACEEMVNKHPELYTEAYWLINYVKVFCKPNEPCGFYEPKCEFQC